MADIKEKSNPVSASLVYGDTVQAEQEEVYCEECDTPIPPKRIALVKIPVCVHCMEERERKGIGTVRHRMDQIYHSKNGEEIEEIETFIVRGQ